MRRPKSNLLHYSQQPLRCRHFASRNYSKDGKVDAEITFRIERIQTSARTAGWLLLKKNLFLATNRLPRWGKEKILRVDTIQIFNRMGYPIHTILMHIHSTNRLPRWGKEKIMRVDTIQIFNPHGLPHPYNFDAHPFYQ